jgi:hypothetical protein
MVSLSNHEGVALSAFPPLWFDRLTMRAHLIRRGGGALVILVPFTYIQPHQQAPETPHL